MSHVKIYQPAKNPMQSGRGKIKVWKMERDLETRRAPEALMGWVASGDTLNQISLSFDTKEEAVAFAQKKNWSYTVIEPETRVLKGRTYLDNFKYTPPQEKTS